MGWPPSPSRSGTPWARASATFAIALIALVAGLVTSPFDEPALYVLAVAVGGFFLFSAYVFALVPLIILPRRCPACRRRTLISRLFDPTKPLGGLRQCRRCGAACYREWRGPWVVLPDVQLPPKPLPPGHPLADEVA